MFVKLALLSALVLPVYANLVIPPSDWGTGTGQVDANVPNYMGPFVCNLSALASICTVSIGSNLTPKLPDLNVGTAGGTASASVDANGGHLSLSTSGSGESDTSVTGSIQFGDTITNNTNNPLQFQIAFHLDAELYTQSGSLAQLEYNISGTPVFVQIFGGGGTYDEINQSYISPLQTVAPGDSSSWVVWMLATVSEQSSATGGTGLLPSAHVDAGNTLALTSFSAFDSQGNPLAPSVFTSAGGFDYITTTSSASTPEPASAWLIIGGALLLTARRISATRQS